MKKKKTKHGVDISSTYGMKPGNGRSSWLVVAHRAGAQILEREESGFKVIRDFPCPEGRAKESKLVSDRPGRSFDSWSRSRGGHQTAGPRHAMSSHESPSDQAMIHLSQIVAEWLETARKENKFDKLTLIAEPRLMGRLKSHLSEMTLSVSNGVEKDYSWLKRRDLERRLIPLLPVKQSKLG